MVTENEIQLSPKENRKMIKMKLYQMSSTLAKLNVIRLVTQGVLRKACRCRQNFVKTRLLYCTQGRSEGGSWGAHDPPPFVSLF